MQGWQSNLNCIPIGIYEKALPPTMTWPERLTAAADAGYDFAEISIDDSDERIARLDWGPKERAALRSAIVDTGMPLVSLSLSSHRRFALGSASESTRQTGITIFKKAIDFAVDIGLRYILVAGTDVYYEESNADSKARYLEGLSRGFEWASAAGVMLAFENWDKELGGSIRDAMWFVNYFNSPWFQLYVDIGNLAYMELDVVAELAHGKGHIAAVHVKDTVPGQLRYVPPGEGTVSFVPAFAKLAEMGFQGPVVLELWTGGFPDALTIVADGLKFVRACMEEGWQAAAPAEKGMDAEA